MWVPVPMIFPRAMRSWIESNPIHSTPGQQPHAAGPPPGLLHLTSRCDRGIFVRVDVTAGQLPRVTPPGSVSSGFNRMLPMFAKFA
jgi:hypothetical protein